MFSKGLKIEAKKAYESNEPVGENGEYIQVLVFEDLVIRYETEGDPEELEKIDLVQLLVNREFLRTLSDESFRNLSTIITEELLIRAEEKGYIIPKNGSRSTFKNSSSSP